jgi:hypothetical protein
VRTAGLWILQADVRTPQWTLLVPQRVFPEIANLTGSGESTVIPLRRTIASAWRWRTGPHQTQRRDPPLVAGPRGRRLPGRPRRLSITADAGGSNNYRHRLWKAEPAAVAVETGLTITVCHFPPGTSKGNKILLLARQEQSHIVEISLIFL